MQEMMALSNSQALILQNQSTQLADFHNCVNLLKVQLSSQTDDFCQLKQSSKQLKVDDPLSESTNIPSPQAWEPPTLNQDTHFSTVHFCDGDQYLVLKSSNPNFHWK